ncbi:MAG TPA: hypothetical protein VGG41_09170 [Solirubrobacteraceae bacterium]|jgi:hypothetical protein
MRRRGAALAAAATLLLSVAGCETTQEQSAKIGRALGKQSAVTSQTSLGSASRAVHVKSTVVISSGGSGAVAVELTNTSAHAQVDFPILINVADAAGKSVYENNTKGIEPSLQQLTLLAPHATTWWVDNEVLATAPKTVTARVGASQDSAPASIPQITTSKASASASFPGPHVSATVTNRSKLAQRQLAVYAVILKGGRAVGAGRAVVASLAAGASTQVLIPVIGAISGSTIALTSAPTTLH